MQTKLRGDSDHDMPEHRNIARPDFKTAVRHDGESVGVALIGELDMAACFKLEAEIDRLLAGHEVRRLVLDLAELTFVDSAGLGALLAIRDRTQELGIEMLLVNPSDPVRRTLDLSGTASVFRY
jgi:anti-anti-sigma factor